MEAISVQCNPSICCVSEHSASGVASECFCNVGEWTRELGENDLVHFRVFNHWYWFYFITPDKRWLRVCFSYLKNYSFDSSVSLPNKCASYWNWLRFTAGKPRQSDLLWHQVDCGASRCHLRAGFPRSCRPPSCTRPRGRRRNVPSRSCRHRGRWPSRVARNALDKDELAQSHDVTA